MIAMMQVSMLKDKLESLVEDVGVDDRLIEEYNAWYQLEQKEFEIEDVTRDVALAWEES